MVINSMNLTNAVLSGYNMINQVRLAGALMSQGGSDSSVSAVTKPGAVLSNEDNVFLKEYQNHMNTLKQAAADLLGEGSASGVKLGVTSSDASVLEATAKSTLRQKVFYEVNVQRLASGQVNTSAQVDANAKTLQGGSLTLTTSKGTFQMQLDPSEAENNQELFEALAEEINQLDAGVTAQVVEKDGKISMSLSSVSTGEKSGFVVAGEFAAQTGLGNISQKAQDAVYTVDKAGDSLGALEYTSSSNQVSIGAYGIQAQFKQTGTAQVTVGTDVDQLADQVEDLLDAYNSAYQFLDKNSDRGLGVLTQMKRMVQPPVSTRSLAVAGIYFTEDGNYALDRTKFKEAMEKSPSLVEDLITGTYGLAEGFQADAEKGLETSSADLVNLSGYDTTGGLFGTTSSWFGPATTMQMLNTYNRNGTYNMTNYYAVGIMLNMNI